MIMKYQNEFMKEKFLKKIKFLDLVNIIKKEK